MESIENSLYPDWKPKPYPAWIKKLPRDLEYLFASAYTINGRTGEQIEADGIGQLLPIVLAERATVAETRKIVGKAIWKQLHKSTLATNVKRAKLRIRSGMNWSDIMRIRPCHLGDVYRRASRFKSAEMVVSEWFAAEKAPPREYAATVNMFCDTERMGVRVNEKWSYLRLKKEHDKAARAIKLVGVPTAKWAADMTCIIDGFTFTRLVSDAQIVSEGIEQRHCVGTYARGASNGGFFLFAVDGHERATLLLAWGGGQGLEIAQLYRACNKRVSADCRAAAKKLAKFITEFGVRQ